MDKAPLFEPKGVAEMKVRILPVRYHSDNEERDNMMKTEIAFTGGSFNGMKMFVRKPLPPKIKVVAEIRPPGTGEVFHTITETYTRVTDKTPFVYQLSN
jgi:hypothetical protein